jgi:sugar lactone lactonase YvrE
MAFDVSPNAAALYRIDPDLSVTRMLSGVTLSNGLDWTLDNRQMYYIDSSTQAVDVFEFDLERGVLGTRRRVVSIPADEGLPDGMTVDADGGIWVALHGSGTVRRYFPDGHLDRVVRVPSARLVTCCAFGGRDLEDLYITTMTYGLSSEELAEQPLAGSLFRCRPGVRGRLPHHFAG